MVEIAEPIAKILADLPAKYRGPGGAVAVVQDGELVGEKLWGFADLHQGIPMAADTVFPICSITKHMLCGLLTDLELNPTEAMASRPDDATKQFEDQLKEILQADLTQDTGLDLLALCNNQSGIRDYWAMTVLWGARPETPFSIKAHGPQMLQRLKSFHFEPGTQYSYANTNYYIIARVIEKVTGQPLADLLQERIFAPADMKSARLCADTTKHPAPCVGYEGDEKHGFYPGDNRIEWAGDAGIVASLEDMIAYEKFIDQHRDNEKSWYHKNSQKQSFKNNVPSDYGHGLSQHTVGPVTVVGHGGALRGYRLNRIYAPEHRVSVVALLNEEHAVAGLVCDYVIERLLGISVTKYHTVQASPSWLGTYLDPESNLALTFNKGAEGKLSFGYHRAPADLHVVAANRAVSRDVTASLEGDSVEVSLPKDNRTIRATRVPAAKANPDFSDLHGTYHCAEIDSVFHCSGTDGMIYGSFDGFLGKGPIHLMRQLAEDVFALACPRAMDSSPPGDWTIVAQRAADGHLSGLTVGCWLARNLKFEKIK